MTPFASPRPPIKPATWRNAAIAVAALITAAMINGGSAQAATVFNVDPDNIALGNQETIVEDGMQFVEPTAIPLTVFFDDTTGQNAIGSPLPNANIIFADAGKANVSVNQLDDPVFILTSFKLRVLVGGNDVRQIPVSVQATDPLQSNNTTVSATGGEIIDLVPLLGLDGVSLHTLTWSNSESTSTVFLGATGLNGDLSDTSPVPVPAALPLMASVLGIGVAVARRRKSASSSA